MAVLCSMYACIFSVRLTSLCQLSLNKQQPCNASAENWRLPKLFALARLKELAVERILILFARVAAKPEILK